MEPQLDGLRTLQWLQPEPITQEEWQVVNEKGEKLACSWLIYRINEQAWSQLEDTVSKAVFYRLLDPRIWQEMVSQGIQGFFSPNKMPSVKHWVTRWTPALLLINAEGYLFAIPLKGGAERRELTLHVSLPPEEPPRLVRLKTGKLEGFVQTLEGQPVTKRTVVARFVESTLVERLNEENLAFYSETDEKGYFTFPELPEGEYDLWVDDIDWVGCANVVVKGGITTQVKLIGTFVSRKEPTHRPITLRLQFPDGTPLVGCRVNAIPSSLGGGRTDAKGRVSLRVSGDWLEFTVENGKLHWFEVFIPPDRSEITFTFPASLMGMVEGRVLMPDGSASDKVLVGVWGTRLGQYGEIRPWRITRLRVLPDGCFYCSLPEGKYVLMAEPIGENSVAPSFSPPVVVKGGEITRVEWRLKPAAHGSIEFSFPLPIPQLGTLHIRTRHYDQTYEAHFPLPLPLALATPLGYLGWSSEERLLWEPNIWAAPGFYQVTSWDWQGKELRGVVRVNSKMSRLTLVPPSALPTLTVKGSVILPEGKPAANAIVAIYDPDQSMLRRATICDEHGRFQLSFRIPTKAILEQQHLDTLLPNSTHQLWLIAWKVGYGHSLIHRLSRPVDLKSTVDVGAMSLVPEKHLEGQVINADGKPLPFASIVLLPADAGLFMPAPSQETIWWELTAFEGFNVGSLPHAQADANGHFRVNGLREGRYLLVAGIFFRHESQPYVAYQFINVPSKKVTVSLSKAEGRLEGQPENLNETLPFAEVRIWLPCWRRIFPEMRTDSFGHFRQEGLPLTKGVPSLAWLLHRDGIAVTFNPPQTWRYAVSLRP